MPSESKGPSANRDLSGRKDAVYLPSEILLNIVSFVQLQDNPQTTLYSCCLVSRSWYTAAIVLLYREPVLKGKKYELFFRTICPGEITHKAKSPLSEYVKTLDLSSWPHTLGASVTQKLLGMVGGGLEGFIAPFARARHFP
jgi:hypothetical protein